MQTITQDLALALVKQHWQLEGAVKELPSYADRNFRISDASGTYVFKIANPGWSYDDLDIENAALMHLEKTCQNLSLPRVKLAQDGRHIIPLLTENAETCHMRVLTYVEGDIYANVAAHQDIDNTFLATSLGRAVAQLGQGLSGFDHANINRFVDWSMSNLPDLLIEIPNIDDSILRELVTRYASYYAHNETKWKQTLPLAVIHNDANDFNVIVASDSRETRPHVNAIIDFGDMCRHFRIVDLAIAMTYALQYVEDDDAVLECAVATLRGYQQTTPLLREEVEVLFHLIMARLSQSILMATIACRRAPDNTYIMISQKGVRRLIAQLDAMSFDTLQARFLAVLA